MFVVGVVKGWLLGHLRVGFLGFVFTLWVCGAVFGVWLGVRRGGGGGAVSNVTLQACLHDLPMYRSSRVTGELTSRYGIPVCAFGG